MQDAQSTTDLSFRFRTSRAESLLVLIAGRTDYCLVMLQAGAIKVSLTEFFQYTDKSNEESSNTCTTLGGRLGKKCLLIVSGLLWANVDIYRILLVKKNSCAYNIKFWAPGIFVLLYCKHYNDSLAPTPNGRL